jgi:hypothetical protein
VRTRTALGAVAVAMMALPASALAEGGVYEARYVSRTADLVIESGETATSSMTATNIGTGTWDPSFARLGTSNPRDRASSFYNASDWWSNGRPALVDQPSVAPGQNGSFTFVVRAPEVSSQAVFDEFFSPVADGQAWMENDASGWPPGGVPIRYTVVPRSPPTARITSSPDRVGQGEPIPVAAQASDNVRIAKVAFSIDGKVLANDTSAPYSASLPSNTLAFGRHTIEARAFDGAGQQASSNASVEVLDASPGAPNGNPTVSSAHVTGGFGKKRRSRITVGYGKGARLRGRLLTPDGRPVAGATLEVASRILAGNRGFRVITGAHPVTGADGRFSYRVPKGASRQVRIAYRAYSRDTTFAAQRLFSMRTRAGVRLTVSPSRVRTGGRISLRGNLRGGPKPRAGVLVVLQAHEGGRWRTFRTVRTKRKGGRFSTRYRFTSGRTGSFRIRALVRKQIGYAYSTGSSRSKTVSVR